MIWESGDISISTWSLSGGSSEGSAGIRLWAAEADAGVKRGWALWCALLCSGGRRADSIDSSISDTLDANQKGQFRRR